MKTEKQFGIPQRQQATVYVSGIAAGHLSKNGNNFYFAYLPSYLSDPSLPAVSLTLPKRKSSFKSSTLFSFFYGLLAEGNQKALQCRILRIDEKDDFARLLLTTGHDVIGAVTLRPDTVYE